MIENDKRYSVEFLGLPDDKILSRRLNDLFGHCRQGVDFENPLDLRQEPVQQPEVAAAPPRDRRMVESGPVRRFSIY